MTEEQKRAEKELEKTLNTLSEEELDALSGGKVTDDVREFFRTEKGKKVMKYTAIIGGTAVGVGIAVAITAGVLKKKKNADVPYQSPGMKPTKQSEFNSFYDDSANPFGTDTNSYD